MTPLTLKPSKVYITFFFQMNTIGVILKTLYYQDGGQDFEAKKMHPSIIKSASHGSEFNKGVLKWRNSFVLEK